MEERGSYSPAIRRIRSLKKGGKFQDAEEEILRELKKNPNHPTLKASLADLYLRQGKLVEARMISEDVLAQDPQHPHALSVLGDIFLKQRSAEEALRCYREAFNRDPDPYLTLKIARSLKELRRFDAALEELQKVLVVRPKSIPFLREKALILNRMQRYDQALEIFEKVKELSPDDSFVQTAVLRLRSRPRSQDQVIEEFQRVVGMNSKKDDAQMHALLGEKLKGVGQIREAEAAYGTAARLAPQNPFFVRQQGFCLCELKRYDEAIRCLSEIFLKDPTDFYVWSALEKCFKAREDLKGLLGLLEETHRRHPGEKSVLGRMKKLRKQLGLNGIRTP